MATLRLRAHAKVNLVLRVVGRRDDGYHDVETVLHSIDFADYVELSGRAEGFEFSVQQVGPLGDARIEPLGNDDASLMSVDAERLSAIPVDQNIVLRAAQALEHAVDKKLPTEIRLGKRIPVGGGMGGGSADAVATLLGLRKLHDVEVSDAAVMAIAARLGADVPFFLHGGTVLATGIGEKLERLTDPPRLWFVLGISKRPLWTKDVYAAWDEIGQSDAPPVKTMIDALASGEVSEIGAALHNDLQPAALTLRPELKDGLHAMEAVGAIRALVSGSGPTIFGLCESADHARSVGAAVRSSFDHTQVTCSQPRAIEILG